MKRFDATVDSADRDLHIHQLSTGYQLRGGDKVEVTSPFDALLQCGRLTSLLGVNGAGKSTLLKTLCGFMPPLAGEISIYGKDISRMKAGDVAKLIGVVLTDRVQVDNMTVEMLVGLGRAPYTGFWGGLDSSDRKIVGEAMEMTGISVLAGRLVDTLSDGERQKVMIAKLLAQQTPVMLLDEPTAFLDFPSKVEIMTLLRRLAAERRLIVLLSTHDLELALQISDSIWMLDKEIGVSSGSPESLAACGLINRYFDRPGLSFDASTMSFRY